MPLTLYVDGDRWHAHLRRVRDAHPGIVPVIKGNGYGFGIARLAERSTWLGVDTLAVGTYAEVAAASQPSSPGSVMVLTPWRPFEHTVYDRPRRAHGRPARGPARARRPGGRARA